MAAMLMVGTAQSQVLTIESWRKDDQIFWDKVLIPAFQRQHPDIKVQFKPEEPLAYDARLEARLSTRRAGDLIFCRPFDASVRMQAKGYLLPLKEEALKNFNPQARRAWTTDDGQTTYCLPVAYVMHGLFYNKKILRDLKLEPPQHLGTVLPIAQPSGGQQNSDALGPGHRRHVGIHPSGVHGPGAQFLGR